MYDLRSLIRECILLNEEWWEECYDKTLDDDESFNKESLLVPDDVKHSIKKWMQAMHLNHVKK